MKNTLLLTILLGILIPPTANSQGPTTYAVVVGISDYQDEAIPDLRFADKDAEAFAAFLQSPAGGELEKDQLKLLTNEDASAGQVAAALYWLMDVSGEDDKAIFYFSGHGDVEVKLKRQPGFLLCWDALSSVYLAGGVIDLRMLQDVISAISLDNQSKVMVITDACRSGKLSGSQIGGAQATANNLAQQYANEIKILSCQPNEYSIEGEQWGGGRGAFSYHLIEGLVGLADVNDDLSVNLKEIGRYLEDKVAEEVAPEKQNPMTVGSKLEELTLVDSELLKELQKGKQGQLQLFSEVGSRGIEEEALAQVDSNIVEIYFAFKQSLKDKHFLEPQNACADVYYEQLIKVPALQPLHASMSRNYAAALQDDAQQVLNKILRDDLDELAKSDFSVIDEYGRYPQLLRRAAELLETGHYMHNILLARSYWFEGYALDKRLGDGTKRTVKGAERIIPFYYKAMSYQGDMPYTWLELALTYGQRLHQLDSLEHYAAMVKSQAPQWITLYSSMAYAYINIGKHDARLKEKTFPKAKWWIDRGLEVDSNSLLMLDALSYWYSVQERHDEGIQILDELIQSNPKAIFYHYKADALKAANRIAEAEQAYLKAIELDSTFLTDKWGLINLYSISNRHEQAVQLLRKAIAMDTTISGLYTKLGNEYRYMKQYEKAIDIYRDGVRRDSSLLMAYMYTGFCLEALDRNEEAEKEFVKVMRLRPDYYRSFFVMARIRSVQNKIDEAYEYLRISLQKNEKQNKFNSYEHLQKVKMFDNMRANEERWNELMKKYFPDQYKK